MQTKGAQSKDLIHLIMLFQLSDDLIMLSNDEGNNVLAINIGAATPGRPYKFLRHILQKRNRF
jgi:hypothetical protein